MEDNVLKFLYHSNAIEREYSGQALMDAEYAWWILRKQPQIPTECFLLHLPQMHSSLVELVPPLRSQENCALP